MQDTIATPFELGKHKTRPTRQNRARFPRRPGQGRSAGPAIPPFAARHRSASRGCVPPAAPVRAAAARTCHARPGCCVSRTPCNCDGQPLDVVRHLTSVASARTPPADGPLGRHAVAHATPATRRSRRTTFPGVAASPGVISLPPAPPSPRPSPSCPPKPPSRRCSGDRGCRLPAARTPGPPRGRTARRACTSADRTGSR